MSHLYYEVPDTGVRDLDGGTSLQLCRRRQTSTLLQTRSTGLDAIDRATVGEHENQHTRPRVQDNNVIVQQGNSNTYALRKLRKDRPDLHEIVLAPGKPGTFPKIRNPAYSSNAPIVCASGPVEGVPSGAFGRL